MPLTPGSSKSVVSKNIREMEKNHPRDQAVAAALRTAYDHSDRRLFAELSKYCGGSGGKPGPCPTEHVNHVVAAVKAHGGPYNHAPLHKVREHLASKGITERSHQDRAIQGARRSGQVGASAGEGRGLTETERQQHMKAGIPEDDRLLTHLHMKGDGYAELFAELSRFCQDGENKGKPGVCPEEGQSSGAQPTGAPRELPAGTVYQAAAKVADKHHHNMRMLMAGMHKETYAPADVLQDVQTYTSRALEANNKAWAGRFNRFEQNAAHYYPEGALSSPEWKAVKEVFRSGRDAMAGHIEEMADYVRAAAEHGKKTGQVKIGSDDLGGLNSEHSKSSDSAIKAQESLYSALNALDKKYPRTSKPTGRHLYAERFSEDHPASLEGTDVFASGTHRGKTYTNRDLDDMVRNFEDFSSGKNPYLEVPAVIGHEEDQELLDRSDLPAAAYARALYRVSDILKADMDDLASEVADLIEARRYKKISAEVYDQPPDGVGTRDEILAVLKKRGIDPAAALAEAKEWAPQEEERQKKEVADGARPRVEPLDSIIDNRLRSHLGKMLRRIAFLGADVPQVKKLGDIPRPQRHAESRRFARFKRTSLTLSEIKQSATPGAYHCYSEMKTMGVESFGPEPGSKPAKAMWAKASLSGAKSTKGKNKGRFSKKKMKSGAPKGGWGFDEGDTMNRDDMIAALGEHGIDTGMLKDVPDAALAEMLRVCEDKDAGGDDDDEFDDDQGGDTPPQYAEADSADGLAPHALDNLPKAKDMAERRKYAEHARRYAERVRRHAERAKKYMETYCDVQRNDDAPPPDDVENHDEVPPPKKPEEVPVDKHSERAAIRSMIRSEIRTAINGEVKQSLAKLEKFREEQEESARKFAQAQKHLSVEAFCEAQLKAGRLTAAQYKSKAAGGPDGPTFRRLMRARTDRVAEKFSENGKTFELTDLQAQMKEIEESPTFLGERFKDPKPIPGGTADSETVVLAHFDKFHEDYKRAGYSRDTFLKGFQELNDANKVAMLEDYRKSLQQA